MMTSDNDKKQKTIMPNDMKKYGARKNRQAGKRAYSKETNHL